MPRLTTQDRETLSEERRRQILQAAIRVFAQRGYATATIEDVARAAGVSEGTIYNYFRSKEDLLIHIPRHLAAPVFDRLAARFPEVGTSADAERVLIEMGKAMVARVTANIRFVKVFLSALPHLSRQAREEYMRLMPLAAAGMLEAHLRQGMDRGLYRRDLDPAIAARALPGALLMFALSQEVLLVRQMVPYDYDDIIRETVRLFLRGALSERR
ncbi:MAG: TetR/AcrR family transcriptional regulator [Armatimonadetes bacterium]|nr:TetR/AcrR family transcriptional regulator [Armatimonadota bacterium]